jgi:hypothetical protein
MALKFNLINHLNIEFYQIPYRMNFIKTLTLDPEEMGKKTIIKVNQIKSNTRIKENKSQLQNKI